MVSSDAGIPRNEFADRPELVKKRARVLRLQWVLALLSIVVIISVLTLLTYDVANGVRARDRLLDCTTPNGVCYNEGQSRTAAVVQQLIDANKLDEVATRRIVVVTETCSLVPRIEAQEDFVKRLEMIQLCVDQRLEEES